jgi:hypothetical protein
MTAKDMIRELSSVPPDTRVLIADRDELDEDGADFQGSAKVSHRFLSAGSLFLKHTDALENAETQAAVADDAAPEGMRAVADKVEQVIVIS